MNNETIRTPEQIASEINQIKDQSSKMLLTSAVEIGRRLVEAKELVPHGEWLKWLQESVSYSRSTAARLMKTYQEYGQLLASAGTVDEANVAPVQHLGYTQGLILFGIPGEEREQFLVDNDTSNMSKRELQHTVDAWTQGSAQTETEEDEDEDKGEENREAEEIEKEKEKEEEKEDGEEGGTQEQTASIGGGKIEVIQRFRSSRPRSQPPVNINAESRKYDVQYALYRDNILEAYEGLLKTLVAQDRVDFQGKEKNRKEALKIATNMAEMLTEYPVKVKTNLRVQTGK